MPAYFGGASASIPETIVLPEPRVGDDWPIFRVSESIILNRVRCIVAGTGSPSVTLQLIYDPDLNGAGIPATEPVVVDDVDDGELATILNQPIPGGSQVRVQLSAVSGDVKHVTIYTRAVAST
jgi:hypothetical protein